MKKYREQAIYANPQPEENKTNTQQHADTLISINEQKRANRISAYSAQIAKKAYRVNFAYTIITGLLFVVTAGVFIINIKAINAAIKSANVADSSLQMQRYNDSLNKITNVKRDSIDSIVRTKTFASLDSTYRFNDSNLNQQIQTLKETKDEFGKENRPILTISNAFLDTTFNKNILITFNLNNVGKFPATNIYITIRILFGSDTLNTITTNIVLPERSTFGYLAGGFPINGIQAGLENANPLILTLLKEKKTNVYLMCKYHYESSILKKTYFNYTGIQFTQSRNLDAPTIVNKEYEKQKE